MDSPPGGLTNPTASTVRMRSKFSTACSRMLFCTSRRCAFRLSSSSVACLSFSFVVGARVPAETLYCLGWVRFGLSEHCYVVGGSIDRHLLAICPNPGGFSRLGVPPPHVVWFTGALAASRGLGPRGQRCGGGRHLILVPRSTRLLRWL
jgi:hypothetical protein